MHFAVTLRYTVKTLKNKPQLSTSIAACFWVSYAGLIFYLPQYDIPEIHIYVVVQFYLWFKLLLLFSLVFGYDNDCIIMSLKQCKIKFTTKIKLNHNIHVYINAVIAFSKFHSQRKSQQQMKEFTVCSITVNIYLFLFVTEV